MNEPIGYVESLGERAPLFLDAPPVAVGVVSGVTATRCPEGCQGQDEQWSELHGWVLTIHMRSHFHHHE